MRRSSSSARPTRSAARARRSGWNPYVVAAKFVVGKVESASDIKKLAKEIVTKIIENKAEIDKAQAQAQ